MSEFFSEQTLGIYTKKHFDHTILLLRVEITSTVMIGKNKWTLWIHQNMRIIRRNKSWGSVVQVIKEKERADFFQMLFEFVVGKFANILTEKNEAKNALLSTTYERSLYGGNGSFCKLMIFARFIFLRMKENT